MNVVNHFGIMNEQSKPKPILTLAEIQEEAAKYGVKVIDGSARFKAIGIFNRLLRLP